jgi:hypothetical protein
VDARYGGTVSFRFRRQSGGSSIVLNEVNGRPFFVDDNSGEVACINPDGANVVLDQQSIGNSGQFHDPPPGFEEFLSMRGLSSKGFFGFNKTMSFYEELLTPGDALYARGPSRREQGMPNNEGSGTAPWAIGQAAAKANGEIDQVNADVTQAYSIANGMATGSCAGDGPGRPPVPIGHIPSN